MKYKDAFSKTEAIQNFHIFIIILFIIILIYILWKIYSIRKELMRLSTELDKIDITGNSLLKLNYNIRPIASITNAINSALEAFRIDRIENIRIEEILREEMASITHDLRTPLTLIHGYAQQMQNSKNMSDKEIEKILIIFVQSKLLKKLTDDLFLLSKLEIGKYEIIFEKINLISELNDLLKGFKTEFEIKKIKTEILLPEEDIFIKTGKYEIRRIIMNLLQNASKYSLGDFKIEVSNVDDFVTLTFSNYAENISDEDILRLFDKFYTVDRSRTYKSTGIGLYIARELSIKMDANLSVEYNKNILQFIFKIKKFQ